MHIDYLAQHPQHVPLLARWHHAEWGAVLSRVEAGDGAGRTRDCTPAVARSRPRWCDGRGRTRSVRCSLLENDAREFAAGRPWLASLYVRPAVSRPRARRALVDAVEAEAAALGVAELYLYTPEAMGVTISTSAWAGATCDRAGARAASSRSVIGAIHATGAPHDRLDRARPRAHGARAATGRARPDHHQAQSDGRLRAARKATRSSARASTRARAKPMPRSMRCATPASAPRGATAYVTLEPCAHHGRTPPCAEALVAAGVTRVVAACEDPFPQVAAVATGFCAMAGHVTETGLMASRRASSIAASSRASSAAGRGCGSSWRQPRRPHRLADGAVEMDHRRRRAPRRAAVARALVGDR